MELKPCPFCGGEATSYKNDVFGCSSCDCWVDTAEEWNRREYPDLRKLVDRWLWDRGDIEGLDRYTMGVVARSFQKLLKRGE